VTFDDLGSQCLAVLPIVVVIIVRFVAVLIALGTVSACIFVSGFVVLSPERPGRLRHIEVDWVCPRCDTFGTVYVSKLWRPRARRRALGLLHRRMAPTCDAPDVDLLIVG
jgi:hypothetical protein